VYIIKNNVKNYGVIEMVQDYEMSTEVGNMMVANIVLRAKRNRWTWPQTYEALCQLSRNHPEIAREAATDQVLESVYFMLRFNEKE
jgi:hypothetical protein